MSPPVFFFKLKIEPLSHKKGHKFAQKVYGVYDSGVNAPMGPNNSHYILYRLYNSWKDKTNQWKTQGKNIINDQRVGTTYEAK